MNDTLQIYEQIEAIKASIGFNSINNDKSEQWIQRQNLQDLYHQAILGDVDFTIDKKLEQDLWNFVFKNQINHFQTQIKDKKNAKRSEAQANLFFFLEAARGFYTKLLQDIVCTYELELPFCKNFNFLSNNYFNQSTSSKLLSSTSSNDELASSGGGEKTKEKQLMYICQHILTHLGDIARYANMFDQAKSYYSHAIKLVPYLGHPYNQLGILFETSRTNQLSTVFYYIRSIAVRYTFPLAATNLENFFQKLVEIPLSRYPADTAKLTHKDYIQLFLQINALIYKDMPQSKIQSYLDLFKQIISTPASPQATSGGSSFSFEKFDNVYLCQMMAIVFFMLNRYQSTPGVPQFQLAVTLFVYLIEQGVNISQKCLATDVSFILPGFYLAFNYIEQLSISDEGFFQVNESSFKQNDSTLWNDIAKLLNSFEIDRSLLDEMNCEQLYVEYKDYPLTEERNLESFMPLKECLKQYNFKKYFCNKNLLSETEETLLRKIRIVACFERLIKSKKGFNYLAIRDSVRNSNVIEFYSKTETSKLTATTTTTEIGLDPNRTKRRQNVAISSLTRNQQQQQQQQQVLPTPQLPIAPQASMITNNFPQANNYFDQNFSRGIAAPMQQPNKNNNNQMHRPQQGNYDLNYLMQQQQQNGNKPQQQQQHGQFPLFNPPSQFSMQQPPPQTMYSNSNNNNNKHYSNIPQQQHDLFYQQRQFQSNITTGPRSTFPSILPDPLKQQNYQRPYQPPPQQQQYPFKQQQQQQPRNQFPLAYNQQQQHKVSTFLENNPNSNSSNFNVFPSFFENQPKPTTYQQQAPLATNSIIDNLNTPSVYSNLNNIWSNGFASNSNTTLLRGKIPNESPSSTSSASSSAVTPTPTFNQTNSEDFGLNLDFNSNNYLSTNLLWPLNETPSSSNPKNQQQQQKSVQNELVSSIVPTIWSFSESGSNNEPS